MPNTKKISIFKAKPEDAKAVRALEALVWEEEVTSKYDTPMFIRFGYVFIAKMGKKIIGAIVAFPTNRGDVFVSDIVVHPEYQGQGIGEKLYRKLLAAVHGTDVVSFLNPRLMPTRNLHKKLGGKVVARIKDAYQLKEGLEVGERLFIRIKN
jgi:ribosomal protein S18 acetylase RimI-like enzyme